jgi:hypothetical protein
MDYFNSIKFFIWARCGVCCVVAAGGRDDEIDVAGLIFDSSFGAGEMFSRW